MPDEVIDQKARSRFRDEWNRNFAVSANAGSGKTTAISERLAAIALSPGGDGILRKTAVVTYTRKAAAQIGQRARQVLLRRLQERGGTDLSPLDQLEHCFFGTIHSFCLKLAQTYGQSAGINLNPTLVAENDDALWEQFLEDDPMLFHALGERELTAFLRHVPLEDVFPLARQLDSTTAGILGRRNPGLPLRPYAAALAQLLSLPAKGAGAKNLKLSQDAAQAWQAAWEDSSSFLPLYEPAGSASALVAAAQAWMAPLKGWLADAAAVLAAELAGRYRVWRFERGVQTYADQIDAAMAVLNDDVLLDRIRGEGWRVILDEAQDTDPQQFAVLVEVTRSPGAAHGTWPSQTAARAPGPRPGHFCMVGDGQQAIYGSRADIGNFLKHIEAFRKGDGGELLEFRVTFRAPGAVIRGLNASLPALFGPTTDFNFGVAPEQGAPTPFLQVPYVPLAPGPRNVEGEFGRLPLAMPEKLPEGVDAWMAEEARQMALYFKANGPAAVGARSWGDVAVLTPRNEWLLTLRKVFEQQGLKAALQTRRHRNGDNPAFAWVTGLLSVCNDPEDTFEWYGVLREVFGLSDALLARELKGRGHFAWEEPEVHDENVRAALRRVRPFVLRANDEGQALADFVRELVDACDLRPKARRLDPAGSLEDELNRLLAEAGVRGLEGAGPRVWLSELRAAIDEGRPAGKPAADAINLLTVHSAKGLEWPVVIVAGLWRGIGKAPERGLRLVRGRAGEEGGVRVYFDQSSVPVDTREARDRERRRELARLLYVALTRAQERLVLPWVTGFGGQQRETPSFAGLWAADPNTLAEIGKITAPSAAPVEIQPGFGAGDSASQFQMPTLEGRPAPQLPARLLPHELTMHVDRVRGALHEAGADQPAVVGGEEAIAYGLWWHETMEFLPWTGSQDEKEAYGANAVAKAEAFGFGTRAKEEWQRLMRSAAFAEMCSPRWSRLAEVGVFAPLAESGWVDGVVDLVLLDRHSNEVWIVDWKTNRVRPGESQDDFLSRLGAEYTPQLNAYGRSVRGFFPACSLHCFVYGSSMGAWVEVSHG